MQMTVKKNQCIENYYQLFEADMSFLNLERQKRLAEKLKKGNILCLKDVVPVSDLVLENLGVTQDEKIWLRSRAEKYVFKPFTTASNLLSSSKWNKISFGCKSLDYITNGGICKRGITELCGEAGSGKTQILLQLSLMVQHTADNGGLGKGVVFICTEDPFPSKRLSQLISSYKKRFGHLHVDYSENIFIQHIIELEKLLECVSIRLSSLMATKNIGLIIIDSVAAIFRVENNYIKRANNMRQLARQLLALSDTYECAVICVNQVSSLVDNSNKNKLVPCLGLAWANLVRTRLQIWRKPESLVYVNGMSEQNEKVPSVVREMKIIFSADTPNNSCKFLIVPDGIVDVP